MTSRNMPTLILLLILVLISCSMYASCTFPRPIASLNHDYEELDDETIIDRINFNNPAWTAGLNKNFEGMRVRDMKELSGIEMEEEDEIFMNATERSEGRKIKDICGSVYCGRLSCCNGGCYNPVQYTCTNGQLCPYGMKACGSACYNPTEFNCNNNGVLNPGAEEQQQQQTEQLRSATNLDPLSPLMHGQSASITEQDTSTSLVSATVPTSFDSRTKWPACESPIKSQGSCGGCWAFSAASVLSDRICIASNGATKVDLSPQYQIDCNSYNLGCRGGYMSKTWTFLGETGTTTETCIPYVSASNTATKTCSATCSAGSFVRYRADSSTIKKFASTDFNGVMTDIMTHGPVHASYYVYSDFYYYKSGVYTHTYGSFQFGHAIKIVGWGTDSASGLPYWTVANSWGPSFGMNGYFWIRRGTNEANIENYLYSARSL